MAMNTSLDMIDERLRRLENYVYGQGIKCQNEEKLIDSVILASRKLADIVSKNEKVSSALKRVDEIQKYADPLYAECDILIPESIQLQLIMSKEKELKEALENSQKLTKLKILLDSQVIQDIPKLKGNLTKLAFIQDRQAKVVSQLTEDTYMLTKNYSDFINQISLKLAEIDSNISKKDLSKEPEENS